MVMRAPLISLIFCLFLISSASAVQPKVIIDIGHTPKTQGVISSQGVAEYKYNKNIAEFLFMALQNKGINTVIINAQGKEITLKQRAALVNNEHGSLLISIHHDSVQPRYLSSWSYDGHDYSYSDRFSGYSVFLSTKNKQYIKSVRLAQLLGMLMRHWEFSPSYHHAEMIQGESRMLLDSYNGIYRYDDLVLLKSVNVPAVLLECGVIVNRQEEGELQKEEVQRRIVNAIAGSVETFLKGIKGDK